MKAIILNHPLVAHKLSILRDKKTGTKEFRELISELSSFLCYEALRDAELKEVEIETPLTKMKAEKLNEDKYAFIPILRAGTGMLDGLNLSTLKGALMSRGTREIARLIKEMGGNELSAYGLCHLGDYEATVFSEFSHNRRFGELYIKGEHSDDLAEGYYTVKAMVGLEKMYNVELPICHMVYEVLYENRDPKEALEALFTRSLKNEF